MTKEVMKQALEALNLVNLEFVCNGSHHAKKDRHELGDVCPVKARYQLAIEALEEALKQEQGEPVAWMDQITFDNDHIIKAVVRRKQDEQHNIPLYTTPQTKEWVSLTKMELVKIGVFPFGKSYELYEAVDAKLKEKNA